MTEWIILAWTVLASLRELEELLNKGVIHPATYKRIRPKLMEAMRTIFFVSEDASPKVHETAEEGKSV